jgi:hypothetical protein
MDGGGKRTPFSVANVSHESGAQHGQTFASDWEIVILYISSPPPFHIPGLGNPRTIVS